MRPPADSPLGRLLDGAMRPGEVVWVGLRPARRAPMQVVGTARAVPGVGLDGDRYHSKTNGGRQVTLIAAEDLAAMAGFLGLDEVTPEQMRRNVVTRGINLLALKDRTFRLGGAVLAGSGECHPCTRMEETFGAGGYNAARGRGGITARVLEGGDFGLGDTLVRLD